MVQCLSCRAIVHRRDAGGFRRRDCPFCQGTLPVEGPYSAVLMPTAVVVLALLLLVALPATPQAAPCPGGSAATAPVVVAPP